jgi:anti-anti-sigma factor
MSLGTPGVWARLEASASLLDNLSRVFVHGYEVSRVSCGVGGVMADGWPFDVWLNVGVRPVRDGVALATVTGEIDIATVASLKTSLAPLTSDPAVRLLVCDLSEVSFFGCAAVSVLLDARATLLRRGARLRLVATGRAVLRPLAVMSLLDLLPVSPDVHSALLGPEH